MEAEKPHKDIYKFYGNISYRAANDTAKVPVSIDNVAWMNSVLATGHIVGCAIYTGTDTRSVLNTVKSKMKFATIDYELDRICIVLCIMTVCLSILMTVLSGTGVWHIYLIKFFFLLTHIIPVGLRVNLDVEKITNSYFIGKDKKIPGIIVRTTTIPEELGRIRYLLTDKTGTLTKNGTLQG
jgi:phospholipid-translocating ATPase